MDKIPIFYNNYMNFSYRTSRGLPSISGDFSKKIYEACIKRFGVFNFLDIEFEAVGKDDLALVHSLEYIHLIEDIEYASKVIGASAKNYMNAILWQAGAVCNSVRYSIDNATNTIAFTHGGHHAGYDYGRGFCLVNNLVLAARLLIINNKNIKIGIIDVDAHVSDGVLDIIKRKNIENIQVYSLGERCFGKGDEELFFVDILKELITFKDCDVILYHAGVDAHVYDLRANGFLINEDIRLRDFLVFDFCNKNSIPVSVIFGGGYQHYADEVLDLYLGIVEEFINIESNISDGHS